MRALYNIPDRTPALEALRQSSDFSVLEKPVTEAPDHRHLSQCNEQGHKHPKDIHEALVAPRHLPVEEDSPENAKEVRKGHTRHVEDAHSEAYPWPPRPETWGQNLEAIDGAAELSIDASERDDALAGGYLQAPQCAQNRENVVHHHAHLVKRELEVEHHEILELVRNDAIVHKLVEDPRRHQDVGLALGARIPTMAHPIAEPPFSPAVRSQDQHEHKDQGHYGPVVPQGHVE
mmetsp:Transcript_61140/g.134430  ORF Transcript_61140/g.134430 Transcript_61140/m.134430 type:complete len:233 (+) Transcript_61140:13-711(+)